MSVDCVHPQQATVCRAWHRTASLANSSLDNTLLPSSPAQRTVRENGNRSRVRLPPAVTQQPRTPPEGLRAGEKPRWSLRKAPRHPWGEGSLDSSSIVKPINYLLTTVPLSLSIPSLNSCDSPKVQMSAFFLLHG